LNTPGILENSGIKTDETLFVDPVLCVAAKYPDAFQNRELPMPFAVPMDGYIISPYAGYFGSRRSNRQHVMKNVIARGCMK
jgi:hypothetical protein